MPWQRAHRGNPEAALVRRASATLAASRCLAADDHVPRLEARTCPDASYSARRSFPWFSASCHSASIRSRRNRRSAPAHLRGPGGSLPTRSVATSGRIGNLGCQHHDATTMITHRRSVPAGSRVTASASLLQQVPFAVACKSTSISMVLPFQHLKRRPAQTRHAQCRRGVFRQRVYGTSISQPVPTSIDKGRFMHYHVDLQTRHSKTDSCENRLTQAPS